MCQKLEKPGTEMSDGNCERHEDFLGARNVPTNGISCYLENERRWFTLITPSNIFCTVLY